MLNRFQRKWEPLDDTIWSYQTSESVFFFIYGKVKHKLNNITVTYKLIPIDTSKIDAKSKDNLIRKYYLSTRHYLESGPDSKRRLAMMQADNIYDDLEAKQYSENFDSYQDLVKHQGRTLTRIRKALDIRNNRLIAAS